ncbi:MAG: DUF1244 domain-containing protein [Gammaproteobacteria bacterium]|nr:DUF1244 domain-containing protein [Gammaproteobacteria bacterium]
MDEPTRTGIEAAAFRRLLQHLDAHREVQNIDLMNLAGFCRNCLARWYREAAAERGVTLDDGAARERIYGMPYGEWKARFQREATPAQQQDFAARRKD